MLVTDKLLLDGSGYFQAVSGGIYLFRVVSGICIRVLSSVFGWFQMVSGGFRSFRVRYISSVP